MPSKSDKSEDIEIILAQGKRDLKSRRAEERLRGITTLERLKTLEARLLLVEALKDKLSYVGAVAAKALSKEITPEIADSLIRHFEWASEDGHERDPGCSVRIEIAIALGNVQSRKAEGIFRIGIKTVQMEMVGFGLEDTAVNLRGNCALALAQIGAPGAVVDLAILLFDPAETVRRAAAQALCGLNDPAGGIPLILKLVQSDSAPDVLVECMNSLAALEEPRAVEFISPYLEAPDSFLAAGAAMALGRTRSLDVLPVLLKALDNGRANLIEALAAAVATMRLAQARSALLERTFSEQVSMRSACTAALAVFPDQEVEDRLRSLAESDPNAKVRKAAARALGI